MEAYKDFNGSSLRLRISSRVTTLVREFENLIEEIQSNNDHVAFSSGNVAASRAVAASDIAQKGFRMQGMTMQMVSAAEDLVSLSRQMQELWLYGKLDAADLADTQSDALHNANHIAELLERIAKDGARRMTMSGG